jgi:hypothetical protein
MMRVHRTVNANRHARSVAWRYGRRTMKIQEQDIYHGPGLVQIVEHKSFKALNRASSKYGHYLINTDRHVFAKYSTKKKTPWLQPDTLRAEKCRSLQGAALPFRDPCGSRACARQGGSQSPMRCAAVSRGTSAIVARRWLPGRDLQGVALPFRNMDSTCSSLRVGLSRSPRRRAAVSRFRQTHHDPVSRSSQSPRRCAAVSSYPPAGGAPLPTSRRSLQGAALPFRVPAVVRQ